MSLHSLSPISRTSGPRNPTPLAIIHSASPFSHSDFPSSWPTILDVDLLDIFMWPSQTYFRKGSNIWCIYREKIWARHIRHFPHNQDRSHADSVRVSLIRARYGPQSRSCLSMQTTVLAGLVEAPFRNDSRIEYLPFWASIWFAVGQYWNIRSFSGY
jgi:hypothetical protein